MSEFTNHRNERIKKLTVLFQAILEEKNVRELYLEYKGIINRCIPSDLVYLVDDLVKMDIPMPKLKKGINKLLNLLYKPISEYPYTPPREKSFLWILEENNRIMLSKLNGLKPLIKSINQGKNPESVKKNTLVKFRELEPFMRHYIIKENLLFPLIEKKLPEFRCLSVMWSFHDDIRRNLKKTIDLLSGDFDLKQFNRYTGDLFFNINAIKFREERILHPLVADIIPARELDSLIDESLETGFPYYQPETKSARTFPESKEKGMVDLDTGILSVDQIRMVFNHLPVDITFVDENDIVQYFSTPKKRIFPRTRAIIGRDVHNCHPKESMHVVEKIVTAFRKGEKDEASFWIDMKGEKLLIRYFAVRDEQGNYRGVVEVSQEIGDIQNLKGENRLLDWE